MKKFLGIAVCLIMMATTTMSAKTKVDAAKATVDAVETTYNDGKSAVSTVYDDGKSAIDTIYHDGKSIVTTLYTDGKSFMKDAYPEVKEAIISIGKAIGCAAEHVYTVLVKKYFIDGLTELIFCLLGLVLTIVGWVKIERYIKKKSGVKIETIDDNECKIYEDLRLDWRVCFPVAFIVGGIVMMCNVNYSEMMVNLLNPEWNAINYIVEFTKSMIH